MHFLSISEKTGKLVDEQHPVKSDTSANLNKVIIPDITLLRSRLQFVKILLANDTKELYIIYQHTINPHL